MVGFGGLSHGIVAQRKKKEGRARLRVRWRELWRESQHYRQKKKQQKKHKTNEALKEIFPSGEHQRDRDERVCEVSQVSTPFSNCDARADK